MFYCISYIINTLTELYILDKLFSRSVSMVFKKETVTIEQNILMSYNNTIWYDY